jgi:hypothetical protein
MEARMKDNGFTYNPEIAIELFNLSAQPGKPASYASGIADIIFRTKKSIEGGFDEGRFCSTWALGRLSEPRGNLFRKINANSWFHRRSLLSAAQTHHGRCNRTTPAPSVS